MFGLFQTIASPFCEKYWSWYKEKQGEGFEIISFALKRPHFAPLPLQQIEFAGKVNVSVVLQDYLVHSTPINWAAKCVSSSGVGETVSCVYFYLCHLFFFTVSISVQGRFRFLGFPVGDKGRGEGEFSFNML